MHCSSIRRQDLSNPVIYDIVAQVIYRLRTTALATLEWPVCYENTSEHHALAFWLIAHTSAAMRCVLGKLLHKTNKFFTEVYGPVVFKIMDRFYDGSYTSITDGVLQHTHGSGLTTTNNPQTGRGGSKHVTPVQFNAYYFHIQPKTVSFPTLFLGGRLFREFVANAWALTEQEWL
ncbi:BQ5605_C006g03794 [Microbotryum silenes-dioicae]|uniref:BQ5605_C006g03794 protein n=1 Tax=Microbotryum silenes-dioicae TaxID=796604 RepID=A0A2X0M991_9BASI|nr:BQ5605_C006g03794 [Microbotryum silenes-dioicae]